MREITVNMTREIQTLKECKLLRKHCLKLPRKRVENLAMCTGWVNSYLSMYLIVAPLIAINEFAG